MPRGRSASLTSVVRVSSRSLDIQALRAAFPRFSPDSVWRRGEPRILGTTNKDTGFTFVLASGSEWKRVVERTLVAIQAIQDVVKHARAGGAHVEIDFSLDVGGELQFTRSAVFSPADLAALARVGATVRVSAYPVVERRVPSRGGHRGARRSAARGKTA